MIDLFLAVPALALAGLTAVLSGPRYGHRLAGTRGGALTAALAAAGVLLLRGALGGPEALAAATLVLMAAVPAIATFASWRRRGAGHGR
ncbi:hypothetical protein [Pulveribacter sp.]|uniref:hypothetical protein n=1 Tax=Pulveribacter sp. TaxID=2678893 RepID=UPI0028A5A6C1|nr:hypothetical protein [Pulveribacter sp.]